MVVPVVVRLRLGRVVELAVEVPLADVAGGVARLLEQLGRVISLVRRWTSLPSGIQVKTPLRCGVRPVRIADRDGEQTALAE